MKATDVGECWLIFDLPETDMACHSADEEYAPSGTHDISFYCDDTRQTVLSWRQGEYNLSALLKIMDMGSCRISKCRAALTLSFISRSIKNNVKTNHYHDRVCLNCLN